MADAYTTRGGFIKPEVGQSLNTWGQKLNDYCFDMVDKAAFGFENISVTADFSLTSVNGDSTSTQLNKAIRLAGTPAADFTVTFLSKEQVLPFVNASGRNATIKVSAGTGVTLANGDIALLGYNAALGDVTNITPNKVAGAFTIGGALTMSGQIHGVSPGAAGTDGINKNQLDAAIAGLTSVTSPGTVKASSTDTTSKYGYSLFSVTATGGVSLVLNNVGANETIDVLLAIHSMTAYTAMADADELAAYASSPAANRKGTLANILLAGWTSTTTGADPTNDQILIRQNSTGLLKKSTIDNAVRQIKRRAYFLGQV